MLILFNKTKKAISLIEILFSLIILSILLTSSINMLQSIYHTEEENNKEVLSKLDFETTRLFLDKISLNDTNLTKLIFNNKQLLYDNKLLLDNVSSFNKKLNQTNISITLCIKYNDTICQDYIINRRKQ